MQFFTLSSLPALPFNEPHCPIDHNLLDIDFSLCPGALFKLLSSNKHGCPQVHSCLFLMAPGYSVRYVTEPELRTRWNLKLKTQLLVCKSRQSPAPWSQTHWQLGMDSTRSWDASLTSFCISLCFRTNPSIALGFSLK